MDIVEKKLDPKDLPGQKLVSKIENEPSLDFTEDLFERLPDLELYLVGGIVRDILLDRSDSKDYDFIASKISPKKLIDELKKMGKVDFVGRNFGVLKFNPANSELKEPVDIAFPRTEEPADTGGYKDVKIITDHNLPVEVDLERRDLTINAIACDTKSKKIIDPFGGQADLENRIIRAVGDPAKRFKEDYSRMLRAIRFACRFNFNIEDETLEAIKQLAPKINDTREITLIESYQRDLSLATNSEDIKKLQAKIERQEKANSLESKQERVVPIETIRREVLRSFRENPVLTLELLDQTGILEQVLPEVFEIKNNLEEWQALKNSLANIKTKKVKEIAPDLKLNSIFIFGVIVFYISKNKASEDFDAGSMLKKFRFKKESVKRIKQMVDSEKLSNSAEFEKLTSQEKIFKNNGLDDLIALKYLINPEDQEEYKALVKKLEKFKFLLSDKGDLPEPLIDGRDIVDVLGLRRESGKIIGDLLVLVREEQLQRRLKNREEAISFVKKILEES